MFRRETKIKKFKENLFAFREHEQRMSVNSITNKESVDMGAFFDRLKTLVIG